VLGAGWQATGTLEGDVVKISDLVAYVNHDIEDAIRAGLITDSDLPDRARLVLGDSHRKRINSMVTDIIQASWEASGEAAGRSPAIGMSQPVRQAADELKGFLFERVYNVQSGLKPTMDARKIIADLYMYFCAHPGDLPDDYRNAGETAARAVVDYIAGMTDQYAARLAEKIGP
jgi:dGTPase